MNHALKTAVVTGGSAGIGLAIVEDLLADGYRVISLARRETPLDHDNLVSVCVDLTDIESTKQAAAKIAADYDVTSFVHNAGIIRPALIEDVELADLDALVNLHMKATIILLQAFLPAMKRHGYGRVVNMSTRAVVGLATRTAYAGTKSAMIAMTRTWAMELGEYGITVNAVAPGPVVTDMFTDVVPEESEKAKALAASLPRKRLGTAKDVSRATLFFLQEENDWITGQTLFVCGGSSLGGLQL